MSKAKIKGLLGALFVSLTFSAQAAVIDCPSGYTGLVSGSSACQYSNNGTLDFFNPNPTAVNTNAFFGHTDWSFINTLDTKSGTSGIWSLNEPQWSAFDQIMMIFKSGRGSTLVGYIATPDALGGTWQSPFSAPLFELRNTRDVSYIGFFGRTPAAVTVPEPSLLILLLLGLGTVALSRLRAR